MMRKPLPLLTSHPTGRSAMTCRYRCGDACFHEVPNTSSNEYAGDVIARALSRRSVLRAGAVVGAAATAVGTGLAGPGAESAAAAVPAAKGDKAGDKAAKGLRFEPVAPNTADQVTVPEGTGRTSSSAGASRSCAARRTSTPSSRPPRRRRDSSATTTTSSRCCR